MLHNQPYLATGEIVDDEENSSGKSVYEWQQKHKYSPPDLYIFRNTVI